MPRVLLLLPTTTYRAPDFLEAAGRLGIDVTVASDEPSTMEALNPAGLLALDFRDPEGSARKVSEFARAHPLAAVVGVDEDTAVAAAAISRALELPSNPPEAVSASRDKALLRRRLDAAGVPNPKSRVFALDGDPAQAARAVSYPCVLKPTFLAASRGVIRADDGITFVAAWQRIARILREPDVAAKGGRSAEEILVEDFVSGAEVAVEGMLTEGELKVLAIFDKPDPLDGPFFEETIYVTPSRLPERDLEKIRSVTSSGCCALGLRDGPVHAELRLTRTGPLVIELAARSIGGLCSRTLKFGAGASLEELILRHALRLDGGAAARDPRSAGVMMIPIPRAGRLEGVTGLEAAKAVPNVEDVVISAHLGQLLVPLPEGSRYLGFIFSRAATPDRAEAALREANGRLVFDIRPARAAGG
jgi:biotin carboxylase